MISVKSSEWEGVDGMGLEMLEEMRPKAERVMWGAGMDFQAALKLKLTGQRSGKPYRSSKTGKMHIASAPGEPPGSDSGNLRNSMGFSRPKWKGLTLEMEVGSGLGQGATGEASPAYAKRMEYGGSHVTTKTVSVLMSDGWVTVKAGTVINIKPRPYMAPVSLEMEPRLQRKFEAEL